MYVYEATYFGHRAFSVVDYALRSQMPQTVGDLAPQSTKLNSLWRSCAVLCTYMGTVQWISSVCAVVLCRC